MEKKLAVWIKEYSLFFFDFDGLLVDTEELHYSAYQKMCLKRGHVLPWSFSEYCDRAHRGSELVKEGIYQLFPQLQEQEPSWSVLHQEKQKALFEVLSEQQVSLMPGVGEMLKILQSHQARCCVVTNSPAELTEAICRHLPILQSIPAWVTRKQYQSAKPHPDPYLTALRLYARPEDRVIGFEDTLRGLQALESAGVVPVVVSSVLPEKDREELRQRKVDVLISFQELI